MKDMNSGSGLNRKMQSNDGNDVEMLDALMKKLIDSNPKQHFNSLLPRIDKNVSFSQLNIICNYARKF